MGKMFQNASSLKPLGQLNPNCPGMIIGRSSTKFLFFNADRKIKIATTAGHRLTLDPMGKCSNAFFEHFPIGSNVNLCPAVVAILNFRPALKNRNFVEDLPMIIPVQFGFKCLREKCFKMLLL
jgi:hypothetical protein